MSTQPSPDPLIAWQRLRTGNERLFMPVRGHRGGLAGDRPVAAVFRCADAGLSSEMVFGQNWGSLIDVSTWGHVIDSGVMATLEYAVTTLEVPPAKFGRLLTLQDAVRALASNWPGALRSTV